MSTLLCAWFPRRATGDKRLSLSAWRVLLMLYGPATDGGRIASPTSDLIEHLRLHPRTAHRALSELLAAGYVEKLGDGLSFMPTEAVPRSEMAA